MKCCFPSSHFTNWGSKIFTDDLDASHYLYNVAHLQTPSKHGYVYAYIICCAGNRLRCRQLLYVKWTPVQRLSYWCAHSRIPSRGVKTAKFVTVGPSAITSFDLRSTAATGAECGIIVGLLKPRWDCIDYKSTSPFVCFMTHDCIVKTLPVQAECGLSRSKLQHLVKLYVIAI